MQFEDGYVGNRLVPSTMKGGSFGNKLKKNLMGSIHKVGQTKTHEVILTAVMELQGDDI